jgi:hypothetical protein
MPSSRVKPRNPEVRSFLLQFATVREPRSYARPDGVSNMLELQANIQAFKMCKPHRCFFADFEKSSLDQACVSRQITYTVHAYSVNPSSAPDMCCR